jgi:hypothetical protein
VQHKKQKWYSSGATYWENVAPTVNGVLGGFGHVSPIGNQNYIKHNSEDIYIYILFFVECFVEFFVVFTVCFFWFFYV